MTERPALYIQRPPQNDEELWLFCKIAWGIEIPRTSVCPDHTSPFQVFADAYFARHPVIVLKASRGCGKSISMALLGLVEATTLAADVAILGGSGEQSARVLAHMTELWQYDAAPNYMLKKDPTKTQHKLNNGGRVLAQLASQRSVRGAHPSRLRIDEADVMELDILDAALGQPQSDFKRNITSQVLIGSTHQVPDGVMSELMRRCEDPDRHGWKFSTYCWREVIEPNGWLPVAEIERKRATVSPTVWRIEFDNAEPNPEGRAFDEEAIDAAFNPDLGMHNGNDREYLEIIPPNKDARYVTGVDWARSADYTVIVTFAIDEEEDTLNLAAYERFHRLPWPAMARKLDERLTRYPGACVHDATGVGGVVDDLIQHPVRGFMMNGRARDEMLYEYMSAVERGQIKAPRIQHPYAEHKYCSTSDLFSRAHHLGGEGHLPDSVAAFALAWHARGSRYRVKAYSIDSTDVGPPTNQISRGRRYQWDMA